MTTLLAGRNAIITGASQGLGKAIAEAYLREGASVCLCARDAAALETTRRELAALNYLSTGQRVEALATDVSKSDDVAALVETAISRLGRIHILVNNAGVYGPIGPIEDIDWMEWAQAIAINLLGSVLCCRAIVPHFKSHRYGKIIQVSGGGATNPLPNISAYAASKAGVVRFAETLAEELRGHGIDVNSVAPGTLDTRLLDQLLAAGPARVGQRFYDRMVEVKRSSATPLDRGSSLVVYLGSPASDGITGRLLAAVWDPWETLSDRRADLEASDVYTLRRIVPKDRGFTWGDRS